MSGRHAPNSWDSYLAAHNGRLADFADHFVENDMLEIETTGAIVLWSGVLSCRDGIEIQVRRQQRTWMRSGRRWVETIECRSTATSCPSRWRLVETGNPVGRSTPAASSAWRYRSAASARFASASSVVSP